LTGRRGRPTLERMAHGAEGGPVASAWWRRAGPLGLAATAIGAAILYFVLFACAPGLHVRPPTPMLDNQRNELGLAAHLGVVATDKNQAPQGGAQLWYYHQFQRWFDLGAIGFFG